MKKVIVDKVEKLKRDNYDETEYIILKYFDAKDMFINTQLLTEASQIYDLKGYFYYIAVPILDRYEVIYVTLKELEL